jgi:hypothetical protein
MVHQKPDTEDHQHEQGVHGGRIMRAKNACTRASASGLISGSGLGRRPRLVVVTIAGFRSSLAGAGVAGFGA